MNGEFQMASVIKRERKGLDLYEFNYDMNILDILTAQGYGQICSHIDIVNRYKIQLFIELGIFMAGTLPHLIPNLMLDENFRYMGFEIGNHTVKQKIMDFAATHPRCQIIIGDMFDPHNMELIRNSIQTAGRVYLFCDGGNKAKELATFSPFLKVDDIVAIHDYTDDQTGEIKDVDLDKLGDSFAPLDEAWRKKILWLPTFRKVK